MKTFQELIRMSREERDRYLPSLSKEESERLSADIARHWQGQKIANHIPYLQERMNWTIKSLEWYRESTSEVRLAHALSDCRLLREYLTVIERILEGANDE